MKVIIWAAQRVHRPARRQRLQEETTAMWRSKSSWVVRLASQNHRLYRVHRNVVHCVVITAERYWTLGPNHRCCYIHRWSKLARRFDRKLSWEAHVGVVRTAKYSPRSQSFTSESLIQLALGTFVSDKCLERIKFVPKTASLK